VDNDEIFECLEVPAEIEENFTTSADDVQENSDGLEALRKLAFGPTPRFLLPVIRPSLTQAVCHHTSTKLFSQGSSGKDVGSTSKPKKFTGPNARQKSLDWYGFDIERDEGRRDFMLDIARSVTRQGTIDLKRTSCLKRSVPRHARRLRKLENEDEKQLSQWKRKTAQR